MPIKKRDSMKWPRGKHLVLILILLFVLLLLLLPTSAWAA